MTEKLLIYTGSVRSRQFMKPRISMVITVFLLQIISCHSVRMLKRV